MEDTRKTLLEEQFNTVEEVEPTQVTAEPAVETSDRPRDESGRFASKTEVKAEPATEPAAGWRMAMMSL